MIYLLLSEAFPDPPYQGLPLLVACREPQVKNSLSSWLHRCCPLYLLMIVFKLNFETMLRKQDPFLHECSQLFISQLMSYQTVIAKCANGENRRPLPDL